MADTMQHTPDLPVFTLANSDQHDTTPLPGAHERDLAYANAIICQNWSEVSDEVK